jgi:Pentapeptide repeats (9 copies)
MTLFIMVPRTEVVDAEISTDVQDARFERQIWKRVSAKDRTFTRVSFKYTIFDNCYLRKCQFVECDFTGAMFTDTGLRGSTFDGSRFDYCRFSRTLISHDIIDKHLPGYENVKVELARNLRANYAQIGDTDGVNKAILAELAATRVHYEKAALSNESYYRREFVGRNRLNMGLKYARFTMLHYLWGNGESLLRVGFTMLLAVVVLGATLWRAGSTFGEAVTSAVPLFLGVSLSRPLVAPWLLTFAAGVRLSLIALFMSVVIRRLARR